MLCGTCMLPGPLLSVALTFMASVSPCSGNFLRMASAFFMPFLYCLVCWEGQQADARSIPDRMHAQNERCKAKAALGDCNTARVGVAGVRCRSASSGVVRPLPPPLPSAGGIGGMTPTLL